MMSLPEAELWRALRDRPEGFKFRRQHPIGRIVVDFYCASAGLVIEVDGGSHDFMEQACADRTRDMWLEKQGLRVLRVSAADVLRDVEPVVQHIVETCTCSSLPPQAVGRGTTRRVVEG